MQSTLATLSNTELRAIWRLLLTDNTACKKISNDRQIESNQIIIDKLEEELVRRFSDDA